jgi:ADP-ribose pyrophosphatase YjhB (NUDIX family)
MPHIHEDGIDFTVSAYIVHKDKVLLRLHDKHGIWLPPCGHVELNEDPNNAAVREAKEEVGLDIILWAPVGPPSNEKYKGLIPPVFMNRHRINDHHEHVDMIYFALTDSTEVKQGKTEISKAIRWFAAEELGLPEYDVSPMIQAYAKAALQAVSMSTTR